MFLSIVIPAYNEEKNITETLEKICGYLSNKNYKYEIIVVDDGSKDNTVRIVENLFQSNSVPGQIQKNKTNRGKGYVIRKGVLLSKGELILFTDADLSTPIEEMDKLLPFLNNGYDIVIGSRALPDSQILLRQPWHRERMGKVFNFFVRLLVMRGIKDTQCGFKLFKSEAARRVFLKANINRFSFDVEVLFIARRLGYKIKDVPVVWINSFHSKVHILKDSFIMLLDLLRIAIYNFSRQYSD